MWFAQFGLLHMNAAKIMVVERRGESGYRVSIDRGDLESLVNLYIGV